MTIAVLFARSDSHYKSLPECDVWDIDRDARRWPGGCPVVAHPPCRAWGRLRHFAKPRPDEKALALWAVDQVRRWGGVLEHPASSTLWPTAGLPAPGAVDAWGGWTLPIVQQWWGHRAEKKTLLYIVGCKPSELPPMPMELGEASHVIQSRKRNDCRPHVTKAEREHTPPPLGSVACGYCASSYQFNSTNGTSMTKNTKIEWTDHTFNPWWGCQKISPGCDHCYAETLDKRTGGQHWGPGAERRRTGVKNWGEPVRWNANADAFFAQHGRRQRVFCASMADVFDNAVPVQWRMDLFELIADTPNLDWLILTKRIGNVMPMCSGDSLMFDMICSRVWLGATIVNQEEADRDIPKLLAVPASKRFLSMEPLLSEVSFEGMFSNPTNAADGTNSLEELDWVIVGGESGAGARPMHPDWARSLRDQCEAAGVPFLFKQWGEWNPGTVQVPLNTQKVRIELSGASHPYPPTFEPESGDWCMHKVGKKAAGRLLDGRTWDEYPA